MPENMISFVIGLVRFDLYFHNVYVLVSFILVLNISEGLCFIFFVFIGNSRWVEQINWSGQKEFGAAKTVSFMVDGKEAGVMKNHGPLTFLKVIRTKLMNIYNLF